MDLWELVQQDLEKKVGNINRLTSYTEFNIDLLSKLLLDIIPLLDQTKINSETQNRINILQKIMQYSSVDFTNLDSPTENYKFDGLIQAKEITAEVRQKYIKAIINGK